MKKNTCYTYFQICGKFDPDMVTSLLALEPFEWDNDFDDEIEPDISSWKFGLCCDYDVFVENQMEKTIEPLLGKIDLLNKIREENDVKFYLEIVPKIANKKESTPCLAPSFKVIEFCHKTRTEIDIDLYVLWFFFYIDKCLKMVYPRKGETYE